MDPGYPDERTVRTAIELAVRAPSVHNSQPWRWRLGGRTVNLYAGRDRQVADTDPRGTDLLLACGAALHHLRIGFAVQGWRTRVYRLPDPAEPEHLAAIELYRGEPGFDEVALAAAIPRRRSDRRRYEKRQPPESHLSLMIDRAETTGVQVRAATDRRARPQLVRALAECARYQLLGPAVLLELAAWRGHWPPSVPDYDHESVLLVLGTQADDRLARLRAGEALSEVLLSATGLGLASCALTDPLGLIDVRPILAKELLDGAHPQVVCRVGWARLNAEPLPATTRRPLDEVVQNFAAVAV
ncbi:NAD(P)H nitroreductase [Amycolatopsis sp. 195334CR]|uniref:NAD(P)H nitroreductase n=1 Tax=Amycolatopsis sp. 195334CR TaxID=2814588 RepID=UPI001A8F3ECA|nr:NAD(P)H nitroreductase [Amycolatopsis sp. 195334CR]MBN6033762.1 NAD(P)H nitroreductase [Amycolatopsis sp. 195334CR]